MLDIAYQGRARSVFWIAAKSLFLTVITLGIYRFWMKARLRRYYWSSIEPGGMPLEYTGTGLEKLLGFLVAVVFLAIYLGLVNVILSFVGLAFFQGNPFALNLSIIATIPLIFFARYRARRYILARTMWRGLRFGADKAAWSYMLRALGHSFLSLITLGLLYPRQVFKLEKFVTDRTWYGDLKFHQGGDWKMLFRSWIPVFLGFIAFVVFSGVGASGNTIATAAIGPSIFFLIGAFVYFSVASFRKLATHKTVGDGIKLRSEVRTGRVIGIYLLALLGIFLSMVILFAVLALAAFLIGAGSFNLDVSFSGFWEAIEGAGGDLWKLVFVVMSYFLILIGIGAMTHVLITQPMLRHYAITGTIHNPGEIDDAVQRPHDPSTEAEGFADALDVGAAI